MPLNFQDNESESLKESHNGEDNGEDTNGKKGNMWSLIFRTMSPSLSKSLTMGRIQMEKREICGPIFQLGNKSQKTCFGLCCNTSAQNRDKVSGFFQTSPIIYIVDDKILFVCVCANATIFMNHFCRYCNDVCFNFLPKSKGALQLQIWGDLQCL